MDSAHISSLKFTIMAVMLILVAAAVSQAQQLKLLPDDGAPCEQFGNAVSIHGDVAAIRTYPYASGNEGFVYIYRRAIDDWVQEAKLPTFDARLFDYNISSVAIYGDYVVFGVPRYGEHGVGAVYVYRYDGINWVQEAMLVGEDIDGYRGFGQSVAIHGNTIVVGALSQPSLNDWGAAYVYRREGSAWIKKARLVPTDGERYSNFGVSVAICGHTIEGDTIVVGAPFDCDCQNIWSAAYVFEGGGSIWTQQARLLASDGWLNKHDMFGFSVSISGDTLVVGAYEAENGSQEPFGAAYVFANSGTGWSEQVKIPDTYGDNEKMFAGSVSISGDTIAIGAPLDDENGLASGSTYIYRYDDVEWMLVNKLLAFDGTLGDSFGWSVSIDADRIIIGADCEDEMGDDAGAAYVDGACPADFNSDGAVDSKDFIAFLNAFVDADTSADFNHDGSVDSKDFIAFLNAFVAGC